MALFSITCENCNETYDTIIGVKEDFENLECEKCGTKGKLKKNFHGTKVAVIYKGAGFYSTDYKKGR